MATALKNTCLLLERSVTRRSLLNALPSTSRWRSASSAIQPLALEPQVISENVTLPYVIETKNVPVYLYAQPDEVESEALAQLTRLAESQLPVGYVSAMPDVHLGAGVTIGTVFASSEYVCPNAVGVDIGCGMCAVPIEGLHKADVTLAQMLEIQKRIKQRIPTGFTKHKVPLPKAHELLDRISHEHTPSKFLHDFIPKSSAAHQLGTLGGGNHFIEVLYDENGQVWAMLHSGSRNVGNQTASHHNRVAQEKGFADPGQLNYLRINSPEGQDYLQDMEWNQQYAFHNRKAMMDLLVESIDDVTYKTPDLNNIINRHHNYCSCQRCRYKDPKTGEQIERDLWVTRKGATSAAENEWGIIPGSMGAGSFIVKGKGNPQSWSSCSHGAGRVMSRKRAFADISQEDFEKSMEGIVCDTNELVRDEAPGAYKDLTTVMANQESLVEVAYRLKPLINVKGFEKPGFKKQRSRSKV